MAPIADFILASIPLPDLPYHYTHYVQGKTPLSTTPSVVAALVTYLVVVFGLRFIMQSQDPLKLRFLFQLHNLILSVGSGVLLVLMVEEVAPIVWKNGLFYAICNENAWTPVSPFRQREHLEFLTRFLGFGVLLYDKLFLQVPRTSGHSIFGSAEETSWSVSCLMSSFRVHSDLFFQHSSTSSITLQLLCSASLNLMEKQAS